MNISKIKDNKDIIEIVEQFLQDAYKNSARFNDALNGDEPVSIPSIKDPENHYKFDISEILFWVDRNAYIDELESWQGQQLQDRYLDTVRFLNETDQMPVFLSLVEAIKRRRIAPFVGAGLSAPCGYPLWAKALTKVVEKLKGAKLKDVRACIRQTDYLKAAQLLYELDDEQLKQFIRTEFRLKKGQDDKPAIVGPVKLLPKISFGCIITTNFDEIIEEVFNLISAPMDGYMYGVQPDNKFVTRLVRGERCILKLHGNHLQDNSYVLTEEQYKVAYGNPISFDLQLPRALRQIFISHSLLFLGCSLEHDKTLELFQNVIAMNEFDIPDHFAILPELPQNKKRTKTRRLLKLKIQPIWYPVDEMHSYVEKLLDLAIALIERKLTIG